MASTSNRRSYTYDDLLQMKDAGLVAADAAATVDGSAKILDVGDAPYDGVLVIDITAIEVDSSNESYRIMVQGSTSSTFASGIANLAEQSVGHTSAAIMAGAATVTVGRRELPFINVQDDVTYPYLRVYTDVAGTIATGINYTAYIGKRIP